MRAARPQCQGPGDDGGARSLAPPGERQGLRADHREGSCGPPGALLWGFHNAASGRCFPSYEAIADAAGCARSTVAEALRALEQVGVLSWVNRIKRVPEWVPGLFGKASAWRWRVIRTSNAYVLTDPLASKSDFPTGTTTQGINQVKLLQNVDHLDRRNIRPGGAGWNIQPSTGSASWT
jgi:hypothetical protein